MVHSRKKYFDVNFSKTVAIELKIDWNCNYWLLLGSYYKYVTYKCYRPIFLDRTVRIFEKYLRKSEQYV